MGISKDSRRKLCQHCGTRKVTRARGLCCACHQTPGIRERYADSLHRSFRRGHGTSAPPKGGRPLPVPTLAAPGTQEKLAVLTARAARGEQLFHPDDATRLDGVTVLMLLAEPAEQSRTGRRKRMGE